MREIERSNWSWTLYEVADQKLVLSVVCGSAGIYELNVVLNYEERRDYVIAGAIALETLAQTIRENPSRFTSRRVAIHAAQLGVQADVHEKP